MSSPEEGNILRMADAIVNGPRAEDYGHPKVNWDRTAKIASAVLGIELNAGQCVLFAESMKLARLLQTPNHKDTIVDIAGYAWVYDKVMNG